MKTSSDNTTLKKLTLIIGILVAIIAGWSTTALAESRELPVNSASEISHDEIVQLLNYLWEDVQEDQGVTVSIYNYQLELIYEGAVKELKEPCLLVEGDLMLRDGSHSIYLLEPRN